MTRDYVNYRRKRPRNSGRGLLWLFIILGVFLFAGGGVYLHYKPTLTMATLKENVVLQLGSYFPHVFHKQKAPAPAKKVAVNNTETVKPIHFDFYDELPKDGVEFSQKQASSSDEADASDPEEKPAAAPKKTLTAATTTPSVANESDSLEQTIEQELASDLSSIKSAENKPADNASYIIQVSVFHSQEAANRYRSALASAGFKVDLVRVRIGKEMVYRLQQGPYHDLDQLNTAKKRLTERGVACDIRKMTPYVS